MTACWHGRSYVSNPTPEPAEVPDPVAQTQDRDRIGEPTPGGAGGGGCMGGGLGVPALPNSTLILR